MKRQIPLLFAAAVGCAVIQTPAAASGSIAAGGTISPRDAYTQGKAVTFEKLVCDSCPLQKSELNRDRAQSLKNSLEARDEDEKPGSPDDEHIKVLDRDEQELVHYYLSRRFKL